MDYSFPKAKVKKVLMYGLWLCFGGSHANLKPNLKFEFQKKYSIEKVLILSPNLYQIYSFWSISNFDNHTWPRGGWVKYGKNLYINT